MTGTVKWQGAVAADGDRETDVGYNLVNYVGVSATSSVVKNIMGMYVLRGLRGLGLGGEGVERTRGILW